MLDIEGLRFAYPDGREALAGVDLHVEAGERVAVLGPNGAGKTSTIEVLEGFRRAASGRTSVLGLDPVADHAVLTHRMGVMLQSGGVGSGVRALEAVRHAAALYEHALEPRQLLERVGLAEQERRTWRQLSGGEQRRLALALALVGRPQVAFLDEPGSGVDPVGRQRIRDVISELRDDGVTVLLTSHDLDEVERLADHVVILDRGRVLAAGSPASLTSAPVAEVRFAAPPGLDVGGLAAGLGAPVDDLGDGEYVVHAAGTPELVAQLTAWLATHDAPLRDLRAGRQRLEDVFLGLVAEQSEDGA
jgi:ABC-2 type transport system ATP-binding protein